MDLSKVSDQDLEAITSGDMSKVSDEGLALIAAQGQPTEESPGLLSRAWSGAKNVANDVINSPGAKAAGSGAWKELAEGHAPNAIEPTTSAQMLMPLVMGAGGAGMISTPTGVQTSASLGNAATAALRQASNKGLIGDVAASLASHAASGGRAALGGGAAIGKGLLKAGGIGSGIAAGEMIGKKIYHGLLGH
jgi:hypothetical protein